MIFAAPAQASILARVLDRVADLGNSKLTAVLVNMAENGVAETLEARRLAEADRVIVGYDPLGEAVFGTAGPTGVWVSPELARTMANGLPAGLYPLGSSLHHVTPAAQLSLFDQTSDGAAAALARERVPARIDGSISNVLQGVVYPDLGPAAVLAFDTAATDRFVNLDALASTVLGAVNSGEVVVRLNVGWATEAAATEIGLAGAAVRFGANAAIAEALSESARASSVDLSQVGGAADHAALALNLAHNAQNVTGAVHNHVTAIGARINSAATTVIGAVNTGIVGDP